MKLILNRAVELFKLFNVQQRAGETDIILFSYNFSKFAGNNSKIIELKILPKLF